MRFVGHLGLVALLLGAHPLAQRSCGEACARAAVQSQDAAVSLDDSQGPGSSCCGENCRCGAQAEPELSRDAGSCGSRPHDSSADVPTGPATLAPRSLEGVLAAGFPVLHPSLPSAETPTSSSVSRPHARAGRIPPPENRLGLLCSLLI
ncbi:MAG: hypothetical protein ACE5G2_04275 [Candidatus Krumholzibacteriia bacterium]